MFIMVAFRFKLLQQSIIKIQSYIVMKYPLSSRYVEVHIHSKLFGVRGYKFIIYLCEVESSLFFVYYGSFYCSGPV